MRARYLNTIAARLAITIVLSIVLGIALDVMVGFGIAYSGAHPGARVIASRSGVFIFDRYREPVFVFTLGPRLPEMLAGKIGATAKFIEAIPDIDRPAILAAVGRPELRISLRNGPVPGLGGGETAGLRLLRRLVEFELDVQPGTISLSTGDLNDRGTGRHDTALAPRRTALFVQAPLRDGHWLLMTIPDYAARGVSLLRVALVVIPLIAVIGLLSFAAARRLASPIRRFGQAAERLGVDTAAPPLVESGPQELRTAIQAFNRMQDRLRRFVEDRTQMLAAMSHDLRTPLNRLRLRAELIEDGEQQRKMFADLEAMNTMIDTTLAFVRDDADRERRRLVNLAVLLQDVCEDAADAGGPVSYLGPPGMNAHCRPAAIARAVANLVDNAVKYGRAARVSLVRDSEHVIIEVEDDGAGIPVNEQEKVFAPFYRLEGSRNAATGGVGLGLSVARTVAREHGGDITLANRPWGGLCARLVLPWTPEEATGAFQRKPPRKLKRSSCLRLWCADRRE